ncbi:unnamed protein product [Darwinula stevensoni]|uniref:Uncharacterized protein n=1 Tax=Darwinula stevensoni TaxID=69355 RepID=A0A7R9A1F9_9CRUS|nr:unnamed protein product [Darwinula stevensoni]CAG0887660.1 unnamed protein product [Darwinula stevensoni]
MKFLNELMRLDDETRQNLTQPWNEFIKSCSFQGRDCHFEKYFLYSFDPNYGACYTFNSLLNEEDDYFPGNRQTGLSGLLSGLSMDLFLNQTEYMPSVIAQNAGARLVLHSPDVLPAPNQMGMDMRPNTRNNIAISTMMVDRLPSPYPSACFDDWSQTPFNATVASHQPAYSLTICERYCVIQKVEELCYCRDPRFSDSFSYNGTVFDGPWCDVTVGSDDDICINVVRILIANQTISCPCNLACHEVDFEASATSSTWPADSYLNQIAYLYLHEGENSTDVTISKAERQQIKDEFIKLDIYFKSLNMHTVGESAKYDVPNLIASLGGAMGLYLGIALVMAFEILELIILLFFNVSAFLCCRTFGKKNPVDPSKSRGRKASDVFLQKVLGPGGYSPRAPMPYPGAPSPPVYHSPPPGALTAKDMMF